MKTTQEKIEHLRQISNFVLSLEYPPSATDRALNALIKYMLEDLADQLEEEKKIAKAFE